MTGVGGDAEVTPDFGREFETEVGGNVEVRGGRLRSQRVRLSGPESKETRGSGSTSVAGWGGGPYSSNGQNRTLATFSSGVRSWFTFTP